LIQKAQVALVFLNGAKRYHGARDIDVLSVWLKIVEAKSDFKN
jgi:hypothetical protein